MKKKHAVICLFACSMFVIVGVIISKQSIHSSAETMVNDNFEAMIIFNEKNLNGMSSNPYDYIENEYFNNIIAIGFEAIPILEENIYDNKLPGCYSYVSCIAIEEISAIDLSGFGYEYWETSNEFTQIWDEIINGMPKNIENILSDETLSSSEKIDEIDNFGLLAVPVLQEISNGKTDLSDFNIRFDSNSEYIEEAKKHLHNKEIKESDYKSISEYLNNKM